MAIDDDGKIESIVEGQSPTLSSDEHTSSSSRQGREDGRRVADDSEGEITALEQDDADDEERDVEMDEKSRRSSDRGEELSPTKQENGAGGPTGMDPGYAAGAGTSAAVGRARSRSRASSARSRPLSIVPRSRRRGLFGRFAILPEVERPYEYQRKTKWTITAIVALSAAGAPIGSAIFYPALPEMAIDLHTTPTITNLTVALYMLAMSIFPLWWSAFSETFGRRSIYIVSFALFVVFSVLSAVSTNIAMLIVMRILGGGASASVQAVGAGTIADIWEVRERGRAMGMFYLGPLAGPLVAPIVGGALSQRWGWKSTMWFLAIYGGLVFIMIFFCLPETLRRKPAAAPAPVVVAEQQQQQQQQQQDQHEKTGDDNIAAAAPHQLSRMASTTHSVQQHTRRTARFLRQAFVDPLRVIAFLRFPPIAITVYYAAITFGALYVLNICIQSVFSAPPYGFSVLIVGLLYIPGSTGYVVASLFGGRWIDNIMAREARRAGRYDADGKLIFLPEDRIRENGWIAATMYPAALIWFGWAADRGVFWFAPAIANFFFGVGSMLVFAVVTTMLTEFMPRRSSSGIALNNFVRNIFSCVGGVVTQPLINAMGVGWLCTMAALVSFLSGYACIWALTRYGPRWRREMDEALAKSGGR